MPRSMFRCSKERVDLFFEKRSGILLPRMDQVDTEIIGLPVLSHQVMPCSFSPGWLDYTI